MVKLYPLVRALFSVLPLLVAADGFGAHPTFLVTPQSSTTPTTKSTSLPSTASPAERYYQFEEMEDQETSTTEIFLRLDGTVDVSATQTDGPLPSSTTGTWEATAAGEDGGPTFQMTIGRRFGTGVGIGEDGEGFTVEREFRALEINEIGEVISMTGTMHSKDDVLGDLDVGYFSMIDTTVARLGGAKDDPTK